MAGLTFNHFYMKAANFASRYEKAYVCYAFLVDVPSVSAGVKSSMMFSRWFERGWTLQELIAPARVEFYDRNWYELGTKLSLAKELSKTTAIPIEVLVGKKNHLNYLTGERLSWSARRYTSREEDGAYCLLGLFDINMPLLYEEGRKAWYRLQEQILKSTGDLSLLLWSAEDGTVVGQDDNKCLFLSSNPFHFHPLRYRVIGDSSEEILEAEWSRIFTYSKPDETRATESMVFVREGMRVDLRNIDSCVPELNDGQDQVLWTGQALFNENKSHVQGIMCIQASLSTVLNLPVFRTSSHLWLVPINPSSLANSCHREPYFLFVTMPAGKLRSIEYTILRNQKYFAMDDTVASVELDSSPNPEFQWDLELESTLPNCVHGKSNEVVLVYIPVQESGNPSFYFTANLCLRIRMISDSSDVRVILSVYLDAMNTLCSLRNWDETGMNSVDSPPRKILLEGKSDRDEVQVAGTDFIVKAAVKPKLHIVQYQITVQRKLSAPVQLVEREPEISDD